ncbi:MAG: hypothetical protein FWD73_05865 [Polyangiaceae bacterium]|nr:hypothetical protein [Polyangiaceae bacterium]
MKIFTFAGLIVAVGCVASCATPFGEAPGPDAGSDQTNGDLDGGVVDPGATFSFVQTDGPVYVRQGQPATIPIAITRNVIPGPDIQIKVVVKLGSIHEDSLTIPSGSSTGKLAITVDSAAPQGPTSMTIRGIAADASPTVSANLSLFVRGQPGALDTTFKYTGVYEDTTDYGYIQTAARCGTHLELARIIMNCQS